MTLTGLIRGTTITLDAPVPSLDGKRVRVIVEPEAEAGVDLELSAEENRALWDAWSARGPQGPLDDDDGFPEDT